MKTVLISGLSGAGKSVALAVLEDNGWFCVDNLPLPLLNDLVALHRNDGSAKLAVSIDIRSKPDAAALRQSIRTLREQGHQVELLFLEADEAILLRRFSETRRRHPLSGSLNTLSENIICEREQMWPLRESAYCIDTSQLQPRQLARRIEAWLNLPQSTLLVSIESFGFKYGATPHTDFVFDVRSLPNPYYDPQLRPHNGKDAVIQNYLSAQPPVQEMLEDLEHFIGRRLPHLYSENRRYLSIAVGCTGGQHRSVYIVEQLAARLRRHEAVQVIVRHNQIDDIQAA